MGKNPPCDVYCGARDRRKERSAGQDEGHDGRELDHGEPKLEACKGAHAAQVDQKKQGGEYDDPDFATDGGEPVGHVGGGGGEFGSNGEGDGGPVGGAAKKSQILVEVKFAVDAEGSSGGVHACQFAERHGDGVCEECGDDIAEDYAGARHFEGGGGAEKKPGADEPPTATMAICPAVS